MSVRYKVHALLGQWVRRYATAPNAWAYMMTFLLFDRFGVDPLSLFLLVASGLPAFYRALLRAWTTLHGSLSRPNWFEICRDHFDFFDLFFNLFEEERIIILACPGFEPTHLCDPSDQRKL